MALTPGQLLVATGSANAATISSADAATLIGAASFPRSPHGAGMSYTMTETDVVLTSGINTFNIPNFFVANTFSIAMGLVMVSTPGGIDGVNVGLYETGSNYGVLAITPGTQILKYTNSLNLSNSALYLTPMNGGVQTAPSDSLGKVRVTMLALVATPPTV